MLARKDRAVHDVRSPKVHGPEQVEVGGAGDDLFLPAVACDCQPPREHVKQLMGSAHSFRLSAGAIIVDDESDDLPRVLAVDKITSELLNSMIT